jgi:putative FmdB family regulatory protein
MPTYEYRCTSCGHEFEKFSPKITESSDTPCPECEGRAERLVSGGAGLLFKGSGFYITDYRSDSYKDAEKREKKGGGGSEKDSGSAGDKKSKKDPK